MKSYTHAIAALRLIPSSGGRFEVRADDQLIYSKKAEGRHAAPGEVSRLLEAHLGIAPQALEE